MTPVVETPAAAGEVVDPDERAVIAQFVGFLKDASLKRHPTGPVPRFNQGRATGCVDAEFEVPADLPAGHRVGLFATPGTYRASIRFANASSSSDRDKDVRGMSIKLFDVPGDNLTPGTTVQDFVLNSHPVMVAPNTREFLALLSAMERGGLQRAWYFVSHPRAARIGFAARGNPASHLDIPYWSTTPYLFGDRPPVKYIVRPVSPGGSAPSERADDYLRQALRRRLAASDAWFDFMIQFQADSRAMPLEDATVEWKEADSPYHRVARIRIPAQDVDAPERTRTCEAIEFNPWHSRVEHRPLGNMNRARREIYQAMAAFRRERARP